MTFEHKCDLGMVLTAAVFIVLCLSGCAPAVTPPPNRLAAPAGHLMQTPKALPQVKAGDDLYQDSMTCRAQYDEETGKLVGLQGYVRTIRRKR